MERASLHSCRSFSCSCRCFISSCQKKQSRSNNIDFCLRINIKPVGQWNSTSWLLILWPSSATLDDECSRAWVAHRLSSTLRCLVFTEDSCSAKSSLSLQSHSPLFCLIKTLLGGVRSVSKLMRMNIPAQLLLCLSSVVPEFLLLLLLLQLKHLHSLPQSLVLLQHLRDVASYQ